MIDSRADRLPPTLSIYLDLVRIVAAVVVLLTHAWSILFPSHQLPWPGHAAVVAFFVLSGFVIAHAASRPGLTLGEYINHRVARIWSVAIPALALSGLIASLVGGDPVIDVDSPPAGLQDGLLRLLANSVSVAEVWWLDLAPPINGPFWSLNYEVWYYALFGAWAFTEGRLRIVLVIVIAGLAGPKILLLLPIWALGAVLYWHRPAMGEWTALVVFVLSALAALALVQSGLGMTIREEMYRRWHDWMRLTHGSGQFVGDWLMGLLVAVNFAAAGSLGRFVAPLLWCKRPIRAAAAYTLSAYLYHAPLLVLVVVVLGLRSWPVLLVIVAMTTLLAQVTELQLPLVRQWLRLGSSRIFGATFRQI